jgi:rhodanese-related sulfurtransferase
VLDEGERFVLAEALGPAYFEDAHLPGAVNLDPDRFDELVPVLFPDLTVEVVVYCASEMCRNSHEAAARLVSLGHENVSVFAAGKADWLEAGLPVESGASAPAR